MPHVSERTPQEKESLIFSGPEAAREFTERVEGRMRQEKQPGIHSQREAVAKEVEVELERLGEAVDVIRHPWEHTQEEHREVQQLIDLAFERDLPAALKQARASKHYPRNLDLLHDVLTSEMYVLLQKNNLNRQPIMSWLIVLSIVLLAAVLLVVFFLSLLLA